MNARNKLNNNSDDIYIDPDEPVFTTGVVCRILDIPIWVLKQLDDEGIVSPKREKKGDTRYYSKKELGKVQRCWYYLNEKKVSVNGLKVILEIEGGM